MELIMSSHKLTLLLAVQWSELPFQLSRGLEEVRQACPILTLLFQSATMENR